MSEVAGYTWKVDYWCPACIEQHVERGELIECVSCGDWTIPNDPHAGHGTWRSPCATDNHALPFGDLDEQHYPTHCSVCNERLDVSFVAEYFTGVEHVDALLTPVYYDTVSWLSRGGETRRVFTDAVMLWEEQKNITWAKGDEVRFAEAVERWEDGVSLPEEHALARTLNGLRPDRT